MHRNKFGGYLPTTAVQPRQPFGAGRMGSMPVGCFWLGHLKCTYTSASDQNIFLRLYNSGSFFSFQGNDLGSIPSRRM